MEPLTRAPAIPASVLMRVARGTARRYMRRSFGLDDDLIQEIALALVESLPRFNAHRAGGMTFAAAVAKRRAIGVLRSRLAAKRGFGLRFTDIDDDAMVGPSGLDSQLRLDVAGVVASLSKPLKAACAALSEYRPADAARILGLPRHRLAAYIRKLRRHFVAAGMTP